MPSRRARLRSFGLPSLPRAARPPAMLAVVGGVVAAVIATGHPVVAGSTPVPAAVSSALATQSPRTGAPQTQTLADRAQITRALGALARSESESGGARASRSSARSPLHDNGQQAPAHRWVRPNAGPLTSGFGYRWGRLHAGIDLAGPYGSPILAATDGCITYAGPMDGYGEVMQITDWDGTQTVYGHMSAFERTSGCVKAGQVIALVGAAGDATGAHLHFEVRVGGTPVDPIAFLAKRHLYI